jgi:hypothetical protein
VYCALVKGFFMPPPCHVPNFKVMGLAEGDVTIKGMAKKDKTNMVMEQIRNDLFIIIFSF